MTRRRTLSPEESDLWGRVTRDVKRSKGPDPAPTTLAETMSARSAMRPGSIAAPAPAHAGGYSPARGKNVVGAGDPRFDRRAARRRAPIERRLDLHGMRQAEAYQRLSQFLLTAHTDGCRCVLVITGKGPPPGLAPRPAAAADHSGRTHAAPRGVLKRRFAEWVNGPALREIIARASEASLRDGGAGAWYVFLKKRR